MDWKSWTPRQRLRAIQGAAVLGAIAFHLGFLLLLRPGRMFQPPEMITDIWGRPPVTVTLVHPADPRAVARRRAASHRRRDEDRNPVAGNATTPTARTERQSALPGAPPPGLHPGAGVIPGPPARPGVNWTGSGPDAAARRALRTSVGCDLGIALTRSERAACDERMGRDRLKPHSNRPLMADRRRQAEFEAEADYKNRLRRDKGDFMPPGHFDKLRDMGGQPPSRE